MDINLPIRPHELLGRSFFRNNLVPDESGPARDSLPLPIQRPQIMNGRYPSPKHAVLGLILIGLCLIVALGFCPAGGGETLVGCRGRPFRQGVG